MLEKFLARDRIREGQERTRVTSESIVTIRESVGLDLGWQQWEWREVDVGDLFEVRTDRSQ